MGPLDFALTISQDKTEEIYLTLLFLLSSLITGLLLNGNIGSFRYTNQNSDVVGDIDVEIKLDDKGRFRAKAFSHSADQYSNYLDNSQRSGVGLVYQEGI